MHRIFRPYLPNHGQTRSARLNLILLSKPTTPRPTRLIPNHVYTLPELIDLAELHNPDTRVAWQNAKAKLAEVGMAESALYPSVAAVAIASTWRNGVPRQNSIRCKNEADSPN